LVRTEEKLRSDDFFLNLNFFGLRIFYLGLVVKASAN
jgi:hypothetical protein